MALERVPGAPWRKFGCHGGHPRFPLGARSGAMTHDGGGVKIPIIHILTHVIGLIKSDEYMIDHTRYCTCFV